MDGSKFNRRMTGAKFFIPLEEGELYGSKRVVHLLSIATAWSIAFAIWNTFSHEGRVLQGQSLTQVKFEVDPFWPKPLPDDW
jgi:hypothetical protein